MRQIFPTHTMNEEASDSYNFILQYPAGSVKEQCVVIISVACQKFQLFLPSVLLMVGWKHVMNSGKL